MNELYPSNSSTDRPKPGIDLVVAHRRLGRGDLAAGESLTLPMLTGSMVPLVPAGWNIEVCAVPPEGCRVGDIVVFRQQERLVAHRLLFGWWNPPGAWFLQRGDGTSETGLIAARDIVGLVTAVIDPEGQRRDLRSQVELQRGLRAARTSVRRVVREFLTAPWRKTRS